MASITSHTIVRNEDRFIWYAIMSVISEVDRMIIYDTGSTDRTVEVIKSINSSKIYFQQIPTTTSAQITNLRRRQLKLTKTDWFMLLDGDEIWNQDTIKQFTQFATSQPKRVKAVIARTRNCVGDIYHYLPESTGKYHLKGVTGHLTVRAYRQLPGYNWIGHYPMEAYADRSHQKINNQNEDLAFFDNFYWHMTHLTRSTSPDRVLGFRNHKYDLGIAVNTKQQLPKVFFSPAAPKFAHVTKPRSVSYTLTAAALAPFKYIKNYPTS